MKKLMILAISCFTLTAFTCDEFGLTGIAPENDLRIPVGNKNKNGTTGISEAVFNQVIDEIGAVYSPIIKAKLGKKLKINRKWRSEMVNASASRMFSFLTGKVYINMYGGFARHEKTTKDGFALVLCHELGHHLAGAPRYGGRWASSEGQSDYFASLKCFRKVYENEDNASIVAQMNVPKAISEKCQEVYSSEAEKNLCIRMAMASKSITGVLASARNAAIEKENARRTRSGQSPLPLLPMPNALTSDPKVVDKTFLKHPEPQCRFDTYFAGALCDKSHTADVDMDDPKIGTCNRSDNEAIGVRPLCWYKPANN